MGGRRGQAAGSAHCGTVLLAIATAIWTGDHAMASPLVHMKNGVWGCVDPNVAPVLNDDADPHRTDRQWVARTAADGQCVRISTHSAWEPLSEDHNGLTYVAYRGTVGKPGSFWVPTAAIDFATPVEATTPPPPPPASPEPVPTEAPQVAPAPADPAPAAQVPSTPEVAQQSPQAPPAPEPTPAPTSAAPEASTSGSGSSGGGVAAVVIVLLFAWALRRVFKSSAGSGRRPVAEKSRATSVPMAQTRRVIEPVVARNAFPEVRASAPAAPSSGTKTAAWHPPGTAVNVAGATVADGMVYVGCAARPGDHDSSFIDPSLPIARSSASAGSLGYWPSYGAVSPECRRRHIEWLASGKRDPGAELGYVFLYFYGLERRLLLEEPSQDEVQILLAEIERLRTIYAGSRSFDGYSRRLVEAVGLLQNPKPLTAETFVPDLAAPVGEMPFALKVAIAREVAAGRPLGFELAAAALFGLKDFWSGYPHATGKARPAFLALLRVKFPKAFPAGFPLRNRKDSRLQLAYRGASAGLHLDVGARIGLKDLPDPATLTWTKLLAHAGAVAMDIAPYAKALTYHPVRANSLAGLASCPAELRDTIAPEARRWLGGLPSPAGVTFGELASHALGTPSGKWTIRHRRDVSDALSIVGYAMEPDPEDGTERIEDGTVVQVFKCSGRSKSRSLEVASAAAMFVAAVGRTSGTRNETVANLWLSKLPSRLSLSPEETTRLRARLAWFGAKGVAMTKAKKMLGDATREERELCAWSACAAERNRKPA